uniref:Phospholipase B1, membrane-associated n=1 Tax=Cacopsylla melanoneura TaxID=428564 RepID=A0A8D9EWJ6_9HEMI
MLHNVFGLTSNNKKRLNEAYRKGLIEPPYKGEFPCDVSFARSASVPNDINKLRPGDIDIVGVLGDSITAGNGITSTHPMQSGTENRGVAWSGGGQKDWRTFRTMPNILKQFNPRLFGYSLSDSFTTHRNSQFNVAEIGAMSKDLMSMARELVKRIKNDPRTDLKHHWKLITMMIGSNDFCSDFCFSELDKVLDRHRKDLDQVLSYLQQELPRTLVNLVITPNLNILASGDYPVQCNMYHRAMCPCLFSDLYKKLFDTYVKKMTEWQNVEFQVAALSKFRTKEFAVVPQPFLIEIVLPKLPLGSNRVDMKYMAADCFHLSQRIHHVAATGLWNNMLEPVHNKTIRSVPGEQGFKCPTESSPYLFTWDNS